LNSLDKLLKPNRMQRMDLPTAPYPARWWVGAGAPEWKLTRYDWGLLNGYWNASGDR